VKHKGSSRWYRLDLRLSGVVDRYLEVEHYGLLHKELPGACAHTYARAYIRTQPDDPHHRRAFSHPSVGASRVRASAASTPRRRLGRGLVTGAGRGLVGTHSKPWCHARPGSARSLAACTQPRTHPSRARGRNGFGREVLLGTVYLVRPPVSADGGGGLHSLEARLTGRTPGSEPGNRGSNPWPPAQDSW
jgi:hypothetical protein